MPPPARERRSGQDRRLGDRRRSDGPRNIADRRHRPHDPEGAREHIRNAIQVFADIEPSVPVEERVDFQAGLERLWLALTALAAGSP